MPDREGRGYVLRRILRRAVRFGWQHLNLREPFLCRMVDTVVDMMGDAFPELKKNPQHIKDVLREEEESFEHTLDRGISLFYQAVRRAIGRTAVGWAPDFAEFVDIEPMKVAAPPGTFVARYKTTAGASMGRNITPDYADSVLKATVVHMSGADAFELHDTYGFPIDLTEIMAEEKGLKVDIGEYTRLMDEARERARGGDTVHDARYSLHEAVQVGQIPFTSIPRV